MTIAPESLRTVNSILRLEDVVSEVELGKYYGVKQNNTLRVVFNEALLIEFSSRSRDATLSCCIIAERPAVGWIYTRARLHLEIALPEVIEGLAL